MRINGERSHERKDRMRKEAEQRLAGRKLRSDSDQILRLRQRMGNSLKETARLAWEMEKPVINNEPAVAAETEESTSEIMAETSAPAVKLKAKERRLKESLHVKDADVDNFKNHIVQNRR